MKFIKRYAGLFRNNNKDYGYKHILSLYKEGKSISVRDEFDNDVTKETLAISILGTSVITETIANLISDEDLDDIIYAGGYENWNNRRMRE